MPYGSARTSEGASTLARVVATAPVIADNEIRVLDHGFVRLDEAMASDLSVVNAARVSFARRKEVLDASDEGLIRFLMRNRHETPFEHNAFRFHVRAPIFVAREWFRHRIGCLTGDTVVTFVNDAGCTAPHLRKTLDELWEMWTRGERNGHAVGDDVAREVRRRAEAGDGLRRIAREPGIGRRAAWSVFADADERRDARSRVRRMRLRVLNEGTGEFETGHVAEVFDKGEQPVYRLRLADGKTITLTENHRLLTPDGWFTMREAVGLVGDGDRARMTCPAQLIANGERVRCDRAGRRGYRFPLRLSDSHLAAIRRARSGARCIDYTCRACGTRGARLHAHHVVPPWLAREPTTDVENLARCSECHRPIHGRRALERAAECVDAVLPHRPRWVLTGRPVAVVSVEYVGVRRTYDLAVAGRWHNFVANGVVVHNSFNEFSMRYARATDEFYVPEADDVRTQVGKPGSYSFEPLNPEVAEATRTAIEAVYREAYATYERLIEQGVARELARVVLPVGAYTEFYWTVNARSLMNFVSLRAHDTALREIRRYAEAVERFFAGVMPVTYAAFAEFRRESV